MILGLPDNEPGKLFGSCMNTTRIEEAGAAPLSHLLNKLNGITKHEQLLTFAGELSIEGTSSFVRYHAMPARNATYNTLTLSMPRLPVRAALYAKANVDLTALSKAVSTYVAATLTGTGQWEEQKVNSTADLVVELINKLVPLNSNSAMRLHAMDRFYPALTVAEAKIKHPLLVGAFFSDISALADDEAPVLLLSPKYFAEAEKIILGTDIDVLKAYVNFCLVHSHIDSMPTVLRDAKFALTAFLNGESDPEERATTCWRLVKTMLPNTLGKLELETWQAEESVKMTKLILDSLLQLMEKRVHEVEWLGNTTREAAIKKVKATAKLVGASDVTEDFNFLENSTLLSNVEKALRLTTERNLQLAGKPVDRFQWRTTAATVNAHHVPFLNQVAIPVGFLQSPVFNMTYHPVRNFGVLGTSIGHEITHGYDSKGRFYDENGSIHLWWTDADDAEFVRRSQCFIDQYSSLELTDDEGQYVINNNCTTTLGENIADNVGLKLAHEGYKAFAEKNPDQLEGFDLTDDEVERLFFISFGQMLCHVAKADYIKEAVLKHHHSAPQARINGMMMNSKAFAEAFQCPVESAMNPEIKCEIW